MRRPTLQVLNQEAAKMTGARNKVATIKAYFTWLRQQLGASPEEMAHFLGHKGSYMVKAI